MLPTFAEIRREVDPASELHQLYALQVDSDSVENQTRTL